MVFVKMFHKGFTNKYMLKVNLQENKSYFSVLKLFEYLLAALF